MTASQSDVQPKGSMGHVMSWLQASGAVVLMLVCVQLITGSLLAFYYVPSVDHAHTTVSFIEKVVSSGSWIRSLHHYGSQWLPFFVFLHLIRLRLCEAYKCHRVQWLTAVILLALVMAAGATGYSLPWDARAFFSTRVAEGLMAGLPLVGHNARLWLLGGNEISTLTLSRFFALHVLVIPFLILVVVAARLIAQPKPVAVINHSTIAAAVVFLALAIWTLKYHAPLGPAVADVNTDYLPRPGAQFLWLYESLKHLPGGLGSIVGVVVPGLVLVVLLLLPWFGVGFLRHSSQQRQGLIATVILAALAVWVVTMTATSYLSDRSDPRTRQQLLRQQVEEQQFRASPFEAIVLNLGGAAAQTQPGVPQTYITFCANCHGAHGEGGRQGALKFPPLIGVGSKPRRTVDDVVGLLNDPTAYGLEPPMRSFATKLTDQEKRQIAEWVVGLK
jgi:ubiquinol-cytochrome c reductase cytochrome b subunit